MKILLTIVFILMPLCGWAEPKMEMHRVQATTRDPSGWYLAESTHGSFAVLIPIPFNDLTVTDGDSTAGIIKTYTVGAKSAEGIKFSATEMPIIAARTSTPLSALPKQFQKLGQTVSDVDSTSFAGYPSVLFSVKGPSSHAYMRYVRTPTSMVVIILEYPTDQAKIAEELRPIFLSSLRINKAKKQKSSK